MIECVAGDSLDFKAPLIDGETEEEIDEALVTDVWVKIGDTAYTLADNEVSKITEAIKVSLPGSATEGLSGTVKVHIKVKLNNGNESTLTTRGGSLINFKITPLTTNH